MKVSKDYVTEANLFKQASAKLASRQIKRLSGMREDVENAIKVTAVSCILAALETGNCTACSDMCVSLGASEDGGKSVTMFRTNELRQWFVDNGPVRWSSKEKKFKMLGSDEERMVQLKVELQEDRDAFIAKRIESHFAKQNPERAFTGFDLVSQVMALIRKGERFQKDFADDKGKLDKIRMEGKEELIRFVGRYAKTADANAPDTATPTAH